MWSLRTVSRPNQQRKSCECVFTHCIYIQMFLSRPTYLQRLQCNHQLLLFPSPASALTAEAQKLSREKRELENALSTLKKNSAAAQEELSKASRKLTAEMQSVKRENIRLREVRMYVCIYVHTYMCVEIEDNTVLYIYWCTVHMYFPIHTYVRMYVQVCPVFTGMLQH